MLAHKCHGVDWADWVDVFLWQHRAVLMGVSRDEASRASTQRFPNHATQSASSVTRMMPISWNGVQELVIISYVIFVVLGMLPDAFRGDRMFLKGHHQRHQLQFAMQRIA